MKEKWRLLPMKALAALGMTLLLLPLFLLTWQQFLPFVPGLGYALAAGAWGWGVLAFCMPDKGRLPFALLGCGVLAALGVWQGMEKGFGAFLPFLPGILLLLVLPPAWGRKIWEEWSLLWWGLGVLGHLAGQFLMDKMQAQSIYWPMQIGFAVYLFLFMMAMNRQGLRDSAHGEQKPPAGMRRRNQILLILLFIPAVLASCWGMLKQWVDEAWAAFKALIGRALAWLLSLLQSKPVPMDSLPESEGGSEMLALGSGGGDDAFSRFMEIFLTVIAAVAVLALLIVLGRILYKKLRKLIQMLLELLKRYSDAAGEDYVDEAESTLDMDEKKKILREKLQKVFARPRATPWQQLDGRERVRRMYRQFLARRPAARGMTAREALHQEKNLEKPEALTELYERARYSDHPVAVNEAENFRKEMK